MDQWIKVDEDDIRMKNDATDNAAIRIIHNCPRVGENRRAFKAPLPPFWKAQATNRSLSAGRVRQALLDMMHCAPSFPFCPNQRPE